jgi:hypothetical protein
VATSTTEAEYCALSDATKEAVWLRRLLLELGAAQATTVLYQDNQGTIATVVKEGQSTGRLKHVDVRYNNTRSRVLDGTISLQYERSTEMTADILTKPLGTVQFQRLRAKLGVLRV